MKTKLLFIALFFIYNVNSQVNVVLTGNCSTQGVYATTWADQGFWSGGGAQTWGTPNLLDPANSISGDLVFAEGSSLVTIGSCQSDYACISYSGITNLPDLNGKIAVIKRGQCEFGSKALYVQQAGAIACIIVNGTDSLELWPNGMEGGIDGPNVFIPTIMITSSAGVALCDAISQGCTQAYIGDPLLTPGYNSVSGSVLFDVNGDNCATSNLNVLDVYPVTSTDGTNNFTSISVNSQSYLNYVNIGTYTTSVQNLPTYLDAVPNQDVTTFTTDGNSHTADFCIVPNQTINDLNISFVPGAFAPGFQTQVLLSFQNSGTTTQSGIITLNFNDNKLDYLSASDPLSSQTTGQITFNYNNLLPYETRTVSVMFDVLNPPTNVIGDILNFTGQIDPVAGDAIPLDNSFNVDVTVVSSFDPNDISVVEGSHVLMDNTDEYLHYLVRFQNTGTSPAVNVVVNQILDQKLDWATLQILDASHPMSVSLENDSVDFKFYGIYLPDSTSNEPNSHGYVAYRIKPVNSIVLGDQISAKADIYFDFNAPVITNTVTTTFTDYNSINDINQNFKFYPNPTSNILYIKSDNTITSIKIYNQLGELVLIESNKNQINLSNLNNGIYFVQVADSEEGSMISKITKQ